MSNRVNPNINSYEMGVLSVLNFTDEYHLMIGTYSTSYLSNKLNVLSKQNINKFYLITEQNEHIERVISDYKETLSIEVKIIDNYRNNELIQKYLFEKGREDVNFVIDRVWVNLPSHITGGALEEIDEFKNQIFKICHKNRIPISSLHDSDNSKFHLIPTVKNAKTGIELGISTNKNGCIIGTRLLKEIELKFWKINNIDKFLENVVYLRNSLKELQKDKESLNINDDLWYQIGLIDQDEEGWDSSKFNEFVKEDYIKSNSHRFERASRWLAQMIQYYPLKALKTVTLKDLFQNESNDMSENIIHENNPQTNSFNKEISLNELLQKITEDLIQNDNNTGFNTLKLVGSGPGSVEMLTLQAIKSIHSADLILADKLIPEEVLSIIPDSKTVYIAKKFPGNADSAQEQLQKKCEEALSKGLNVVRLKQGDPYVFGRGGEEFIQLNEYIAKNNLNAKIQVIPGLTSALVAPLVADIPLTMRNISNEISIMTGTGTKGELPEYPPYKKERTSVFLMGLHRVEMLVDKLISEKKWDPFTDVCIIERAACKDQRITRTLLKDLVEVVGIIGSRPPGLIVMGPAVSALVPRTNDLYTVKEGL
ncbi:uroporphyrinogen-III C-methyltransferase [Hanseniaspora uvarum]|nr:uroporphyrinogen-III C-methyltransferase [Hanseniaspora uvarum]